MADMIGEWFKASTSTARIVTEALKSGNPVDIGVAFGLAALVTANALNYPARRFAVAWLRGAPKVR